MDISFKLHDLGWGRIMIRVCGRYVPIDYYITEEEDSSGKKIYKITNKNGTLKGTHDNLEEIYLQAIEIILKERRVKFLNKLKTFKDKDLRLDQYLIGENPVTLSPSKGYIGEFMNPATFDAFYKFVGGKGLSMDPFVNHRGYKINAEKSEDIDHYINLNISNLIVRNLLSEEFE